MIYNVQSIVEHSVQTQINGKWVAARPINLRSIKQRLREVWLVLTGKGDVIIWPENQ